MLNQLLNQPPSRPIAENWLFTDFCQATFALAQTLNAQPKRAVALWFDDAARFASALLAAWQAGLTVYLPPNRAANSLDWIAQHHCLWLTDQTDFPEAHYFYADTAECARPVAASAFFTLSPTSTLVLKTSGSSGEAKIIHKTLAQMQTEAHALAQVLPIQHWHGLPAYSSVTPQHLYGLTFRIFAALLYGWQIGRNQLLYPENLLALSKQPCIWITSPAILNRLNEQHDWQQASHVQGIISAGGLLPESTRQYLQHKLSIAPIDIYGSTETGVVALRQHHPTWTLLPQVSAQPHSQQLHIQSPWTNGKQTLADSVQLNGKQLTLLGRSDRIIKLEDKRISLNQLEQHLLAHDWVADSHCCLHPQHQRVAAWLALNATGIAALRQYGRAALIQTFKQHLASVADTIALPRYWRFTTELPRNAQAKLAFTDIQAAFSQTQSSPQWQLLSADTEQHRYQFSGIVPLDLVYFGGHFAEFPLVPGVIEVQWAVNLAQQFPWGQHPICQLENLKYQQFVRPNDHIVLQLHFDYAKNKIHFSIKQNEHLCTSGRLVLAAATAHE